MDKRVDMMNRDMCMGTDMCAHEVIGMCIYMRMEMCANMCLDLRIGMCTDKCLCMSLVATRGKHTSMDV